LETNLRVLKVLECEIIINFKALDFIYIKNYSKLKTLVFITICVLMSLKLSAQINPNFSCDDFSFDLSSNAKSSIEFLSKKNYFDAINSIF